MNGIKYIVSVKVFHPTCRKGKWYEVARFNYFNKAETYATRFPKESVKIEIYEIL